MKLLVFAFILKLPYFDIRRADEFFSVIQYKECELFLQRGEIKELIGNITFDLIQLRAFISFLRLTYHPILDARNKNYLGGNFLEPLRVNIMCTGSNNFRAECESCPIVN